MSHYIAVINVVPMMMISTRVFTLKNSSFGSEGQISFIVLCKIKITYRLIIKIFTLPSLILSRSQIPEEVFPNRNAFVELDPSLYGICLLCSGID